MPTFTRVYDTYAHAQRAVSELESAGIAASDISLIANKHVSDQYDDVDEASSAGSGASIGAAVGGGAGLLAGLGMLAIPGLGPVVAAGWLASTAVGAATGAAAGGIVGALVGDDVDEHTANVYAESVRRGGTMVTVRTSDALAGRARAILDSHAPVDAASRADEYREAGWERFDPAAGPYKPSQSEIERIRRM